MAASLPPRLEAVLAALVPCAVLADVGTDHGLVPIAAVQRGLAERAIAADLRAKPLLGARDNVARAGVEDRVTLVRSDGFQRLPGLGIDAVVMAGMSGTTMARVCREGTAVLERVSQLVGQPNSGAAALRAWALESGWALHDERMVEVGGRFFVTCAFDRRADPERPYRRAGWSTAALLRVGPLLLARDDAVARRWYALQRDRLERLASTRNEHAAELAVWRAACGEPR